MKTDIYCTATKLRATIADALAATKHLKGYKPEYIDVRIVAAPGEPDIFHDTACSIVELMDLIDKATADALVLKPNGGGR